MIDSDANKVVIEKGEIAIVWSETEKKFTLLVPVMEDHEIVPEMLLVMTAVFMKLDNDPDFGQECLDWFAKGAT